MVPADVRGVFYALIKSLLGIPTIWARQDGKRPAVPFATLEVASSAFAGAPWYGEVDDEGNQTVFDTVMMTLTVNRYGNESAAALESLAMRLKGQPAIDAFSAVNVAAAWCEPVTDLSELLDGRTWEPRASLDIHLRVSVDQADWVSWIDTVQVTGDAGGVPVDMEISIVEASETGAPENGKD